MTALPRCHTECRDSFLVAGEDAQQHLGTGVVLSLSQEQQNLAAKQYQAVLTELLSSLCIVKKSCNFKPYNFSSHSQSLDARLSLHEHACR